MRWVLKSISSNGPDNWEFDSTELNQTLGGLGSELGNGRSYWSIDRVSISYFMSCKMTKFPDKDQRIRLVINISVTYNHPYYSWKYILGIVIVIHRSLDSIASLYFLQPVWLDKIRCTIFQLFGFKFGSALNLQST